MKSIKIPGYRSKFTEEDIVQRLECERNYLDILLIRMANGEIKGNIRKLHFCSEGIKKWAEWMERLHEQV